MERRMDRSVGPERGNPGIFLRRECGIDAIRKRVRQGELQMRVNSIVSLMGLGLLLLAVKPAVAHHSFEAEYDGNKTATLTGFVTKVDWVNPHAYIFFNVKDERGATKGLRYELGPPYALARGGWKRDTVKIGDKITIEGAAVAKDAKNAWVGAMQTTQLVLESGQKLPTR